MQDSTVLPLLAPNYYNHRRSRSPFCLFRWSTVYRYIVRRKLRFYLITSALLLIIFITILHKYSITNDNHSHVNYGKVELSRHHQRKNFEAHTMKTIIGKYVGPKPLWAEMNPIQNISDELLNANNYDPDPDIGNNGRPAYMPGYPKDRLQLLYSINRFNLAASDKISVDRKLPDPRKLACRKRQYDLNDLPNTSVIIVFHNEAWSTLARTVHSILNTAPQHLLAEIILVDDASNRTFLGKSLEYYMNNLGSIRGVNIEIIRSKLRIGLIRSRLLGVEKARGKVLTFIDAHCEATTGWLEPLLQQVKLDRKTVACPIIDIINEDNFAFTKSFELHLGAFNWGLNFRWYPISRRELVSSNGYNKVEGKVKVTELIHAFNSPVMAGGLFSIEKDYFIEIGLYDSGMDIWGGENLELSFRTWMCGGNVKIVPCSHVAHIFRKSSPYTFRPGKEVGDILYTNLARVAEVWMDDWKQFFYAINPIVNRTLHKVGLKAAFENIQARKELRIKLQCKSFSWYLDNVWPEHFFPKLERFFGRIQHLNSKRCLQRPTIRIGMGQAAVGAIETANCTIGQLTPSYQLFIFNPSTGFLMTDENVCLDSGSDPIPTRQVILAPCSESNRQKWKYTNENHMKHVQSGLCLDSSNPKRVNLETCDENNNSLKWTFIRETWN